MGRKRKERSEKEKPIERQMAKVMVSRESRRGKRREM